MNLFHEPLPMEIDASLDPVLRAAIADLDEALRASESRLAIVQGALRALPDGVVTVDADGGILQLNPSAAHLIGWTESQAIGQPLHEVLQLRDAQGRTVDVLGPDSRQGHDVTSLVRRDRHEVLVDALVTPIHGHARETLGTVVTFRNVTAAKRISDELTYHANHDPLTGAGNRRAFEVRLQRAVAQATTRHIPHALLCLDLDRFKAVNDAGGHVAGDEMLRQLTALLKRQLRDHDTLARMGGDEFAILLENCTSEQATAVAERIRAAVLESRLHWHGKSLGVGISIGQVNFCDDTLSPHQLMQRADEMCYQAKSGGRNRVRVDVPGKHPAGKPARVRAATSELQHAAVGGSGRPRG